MGMTRVKAREIVKIGKEEIQKIKKSDIQNDAEQDQPQPAPRKPSLFDLNWSNILVTEEELLLPDQDAIGFDGNVGAGVEGVFQIAKPACRRQVAN